MGFKFFGPLNFRDFKVFGLGVGVLRLLRVFRVLMVLRASRVLRVHG